MIANPTAHETLASGAPAHRSGFHRSWSMRKLGSAGLEGGTRGAMKPDSHSIGFRSLPAGPAGGWRVEIRIGIDQVQYIYGFDSQFDADEWIERESEEWMKLLRAKL